MRFRPLPASLVTALILAGSGPIVWSQSRGGSMQRARPPEFRPDDTSRVFFENLDDAFRGRRPALAELRQSGQTSTQAVASTEQPDGAGNGALWDRLISPLSLEDEIKRVKLRYDAVITSPGEFNGGGYQDARLNLSVLATLFAVISQYDGEVRWKDEAATARDLIARTARNCAAGSTQVYNEAKLRKADLQDLVSGSGLSATQPADEANDWSMIVDRSPMMQYLEQLLDRLSDLSRDAASSEANADAVRHQAELIAMVGEVLVQEGMDEADDEDYAGLSGTMSVAARQAVAAIERSDFEAVRASIGAITQSCADCHEQYR